MATSRITVSSLGALLCAASWCAPLVALSAPGEVPAPVAEVLEGYAQSGIEIVDTFPAAGGWTGVVASVRGQGLAFYLDASGEYLFMGMMLGARGGINHTEALLRRYFPQQYPHAQEHQVADGPADVRLTPEALAALPGVPYQEFEGAARATIYAFIDFGCDHCRSLLARLGDEELFGWLTQHRVALVILPLAFSGEQTAFKSAYALARLPQWSALMGLFGSQAPLPQDMEQFQIAGGAMALTKLMSFAGDHALSAVPFLVLSSQDAVFIHSGAADAPALRAWVSGVLVE